MRFVRGGQVEGFTNSAVAQFNQVNAASAIREFVQNSLDAAVEEAKKPFADVSFLVEKVRRDKIPGLHDYEKALESAVGGLDKEGFFNKQTEQAAKHLRDAATKSELSALFVVDNGVGFDKRKLSAIFGDGLSDKGGNKGQESRHGLGSYGNGHLTAFSLSDLQYVFYGGLSKDDSVFGGHAIIASHMSGGQARGKDGYFVAGLKEDVLFGEERFVFASGDNIHPFVKEKIDRIRHEHGGGAVVAMPAFNHFRQNEKKVADMIVREAALNFFAAIWGGKLRLTVDVFGEKKKLTRSELPGALEECKHEKRSGTKGFPSGAVAHRSWETLEKGKLVVLPTPHGEVKVYIRKDEGDKTVALCRNGMWISREIPFMRRPDFASKQPFDAVIAIDGDAGEAYELFKVAEGSLHSDIDRSRLSGDDRRKFTQCLESLAKGIKGLVGDKDNKIWEPPDFMAFATGQSVKNPERKSVSGGQTAKPMIPPKKKEAGKGNKPKKPSRTRRPGNALGVKMGSRRIAPGRVVVHFSSDEACDNAEFRMTIDRGADATCTGQLEGDGWESLRLRSVKIDGRDANINAAGCAMVGAVEEGRRYNMEVEYERPPIAGDYAIECAFIRRKREDGGKREEKAQ